MLELPRAHAETRHASRGAGRQRAPWAGIGSALSSRKGSPPVPERSSRITHPRPPRPLRGPRRHRASLKQRERAYVVVRVMSETERRPSAFRSCSETTPTAPTAPRRRHAPPRGIAPAPCADGARRMRPAVPLGASLSHTCGTAPVTSSSTYPKWYLCRYLGARRDRAPVLHHIVLSSTTWCTPSKSALDRLRHARQR